ncbi:pyruvate dehydrogenase phosphatase [Entomortierella parvispora]|uniref:Pyruvate dehydrogenase phosphatase n=1 Tax=Entomortierella parvispora TaxID=205924 RepID=A0A9P3HL05_9FUNG|nr:pyruvate dehydrogenase phosphatase [Entomortierella parvispora]
MSLRQVAKPCRGSWMTRILPSRPTSFSTSATSHGRCHRDGHRPKEVHGPHNSSRSHGIKDDVAPIKRRAKKADFVDSNPPSTANGSTTATNTTTSGSTAETPISRLRQRLEGKTDSKQTKNHTQSHTTEQKQKPKSSRLSYEDLIPRQHRQNHWYRQRLLHLQRKQMHQNHHHHNSQQHGQHHGQHRGQHHGQHHGPKTDPNFWWMWHMMESRKTIFRSFSFGAVLTGIAYKIYTSRDNIKTKQNWLQLAQEMVHARMSLLESEGPSTPGLARLQRLATASPTGFPTAQPSSFKNVIGPEGMSPLSLSDSMGGADPEKNLKMMTPQSVELKLAEHQKSFAFQNQGSQTRHGRPRRNLVKGYSINQLASNSPIEDDLSAHVVRNHDGDIEQLFFGIFDGHSGWCCSQKVAQELGPSVAKELKRVRSRDTKAVSEAIERGFLYLDKRIVEDSVARVLDHGNRPLACSALLPAISGSCAIMAYVNERERDLYVACLGDCRAVMGVREPLPGGGHVWRAVPLSLDQTGRSKSEIKRLQQEHPGEEDAVVRRGRVLGRLEPTRTFGDARYKWSKEIQDRVFSLFPSYREPSPGLKTPPYVTAKPVVRHHKIQSEDRFMVMATDGLWDKLTSDEVVQLVGALLDGKTGQEEMVLDRAEIQRYRQQRRAIQASQHKSIDALEEEEEEVTPANLAPKGPASQLRKFTYRDQANVATHLIRNALGGADDDKVAATMSIPAPMSRVYRDDITVAVIFFEQQETTLALSNVQPSSEGLVEIH